MLVPLPWRRSTSIASALRLLGPGGVLVTCSCSHHMSEAMLLEIVASASLDAGRRLQVLERRTQSSEKW